jgi:putative transposase
MLRVLKCKLYPNSDQARQLTEYLDEARYVFNRCLEQRRDTFKATGKSPSRYDQQKSLTTWREADGRLGAVPVNVTRDAIRRVDLAFQHFFRRVKDGAKKKGYPRFKCANRYNGFCIGECGNVVKDGRVQVSGISHPIRARGLQPSDGTIKRLCIVRRGGKWFGRITVDDARQTPPKVEPKLRVGIDLGLTSFIATSDGTNVEAPRHFRRLERKLRGAGRAVSRCKRGSKRRGRAIVRLQGVHGRIADARDDFTHKLSKLLVSQYDLIAAEKLNVAGMVRGRFAKSILDAAWSQFLFRISYKAESAGKTFVQVDPRGTSQECSECGQNVPKDLSVRLHKCPCGYIADRDVNAARNILKRVSIPSPGSGEVRRTEKHKTSGQPEAASLTCIGSK